MLEGYIISKVVFFKIGTKYQVAFQNIWAWSWTHDLHHKALRSLPKKIKLVVRTQKNQQKKIASIISLKVKILYNLPLRTKGPSPYFSLFFPYILIPIKTNEWTSVNYFINIILKTITIPNFIIIIHKCVFTWLKGSKYKI
jgi:hypothetical protein